MVGNIKGFTKEDSDEIGFVIPCLFSGSLTREEFKLWIYSVIEKYDNLPIYIYELADFNDSLFKITKVIGFVPHWPFSDKARFALSGLAHKRGFEFKDDSRLTKEQSLKILKRYPEVEERFRRTFPFIKY